MSGNLLPRPRLHPSDRSSGGRRRRRTRLVASAATIAVIGGGLTLAVPGSARANGSVTFVGSPAELTAYPTTTFPDDPRALGTNTVTTVPAPDGQSLTFDQSMILYQGDLLRGGFGGYTGDIYASNSSPVTMTLPSHTVAFSFYAMQVYCLDAQTYDMTATTDNGTTSGPIPVTVDCTSNKPHYFGFYATGGATITSITVTSAAPYYGLVLGEFAIAINQSPRAGIDASSYGGAEGAALAVSGTASDVDGDSLTNGWTVTADPGDDPGAACTIADPAELSTTLTCNDEGTYTLALTTDDGVNAPVRTSVPVTITNVAPTLGPVTGLPIDPVPVKTAVSAAAQFTDPGRNDTHTCSVDWGDGNTSAGTVTEPSGSTAGSCSTGSHTYAASGVYPVTVTVSDSDGGSDTRQSASDVVVYDPAAGFVTGGGWIDSPVGAYTADPTLTGRANFAFVSKYAKGSTLPDGKTQFQFKEAGLEFNSTSYDWLVISGAKAQYKGTGTVNGTGGYTFLLTATDGDVTGGGGSDRFRLKIWNSKGVVYDNMPASVTDLALTDQEAIAGGSIVIRK